MNGDAIGPLSAAELGRLIDRGEVSPTEAVNAYIERVDALDGQLGSYTLLGREEALSEAAEREQELADGKSRGPLHGVPVAIKEQIDAKGWPTTGGSAILRDAVVETDATVTARLRDAGAIILGKLNMTELAIAETIEFPYGTPKNPWNPDRSTGSSSAGSGVATAAALAGATLGGDTGGSIRIPAAYCGIVGLRPTFGRVSRAGTLAACWSMDAIGPMTRSVEDAALVLGAIAGPDPRDSWAAHVPVPDYADGLDAGVKGLRIGLITELMDPSLVDTDVVAAVTESTRVLEGLGASVDKVALPMVAHAGPIHWTLCYVEFGQANRDTIRHRAQELTHMVRIAVSAGSLLPGVTYYKALQLRERLRDQVLEALIHFDVLVCPTMSSGAPPRAVDVYTKSAEEVMDGLTGSVRLTAPFSHAGTPALSVPCGMTADGLPIGLQVVGKPFDEATVLRVGSAFEAATPWHQARPPIF
jgi:aspartyl-tRNA(Asn)/glutamyl-tRNA(Gln) amidotransferase subunit A